MTAKKRSGLMTGPVGTSPRNSCSGTMVSSMTQAKPIKNSSGGKPKAVGVSGPKNTVNKPNSN